MTTSHEPAYSEDGLPKARYRAYHEARAKGGVALTMTAGSAVVSRDSPPSFNNLLAYKDEIVPWLSDLCNACHQYGAAVMIQLTHLGRRTGWDKGDWLPSVSPSHIREPAHKAFPKKLEDWDIERIITDYAEAAERMQQAGLDGIELESYGHLMDSFWSPALNQLDNEYAGSLENRMRFSNAVLKAIRARVGNSFIVGIRYVADEMLEGGISREEGLEISNRLKSSGLVDFLNIIRGHIETDAALTKVIPLQGMPAAPHLEFAGEIRHLTALPTFHAARIPDVATARHAISTGKLDMVGMTRAHLADPEIVAKIAAGRESDIRPCVGATYCLDRIYQGGEALCIHNPATGRELSMPHQITPAEATRKIVVIGAGPAGMEAARVGAGRGHDVTVFEAADNAGGQIRLCARNPRRREMMAIIDWRLEQCQNKGVEFHFNHWAESGDVLACKPDVVIIATGGMAHTEILKNGNDLLASCWDIIAGDVKPAQNTLLYDDAGDHTALQAAEVIAETGANLEIMTPDRSFAPEIMGMNLTPYMQTLQKHNVTFSVTYRLQSVERKGNKLRAYIGSDYLDHIWHRDFDQIIVNNGVRPLDGLYFELRDLSINRGETDHKALLSGQPQTVNRNAEGFFQLYRIGDAVSARNTHAAIYDALRLMKDI